MVGVKVTDYQNLESALKVFRNKVRRAHILEIYGRKSHYISPSEKRRRIRQRKRSQ